MDVSWYLFCNKLKTGHGVSNSFKKTLQKSRQLVLDHKAGFLLYDVNVLHCGNNAMQIKAHGADGVVKGQHTVKAYVKAIPEASQMLYRQNNFFKGVHNVADKRLGVSKKDVLMQVGKVLKGVLQILSLVAELNHVIGRCDGYGRNGCLIGHVVDCMVVAVVWL